MTPNIFDLLWSLSEGSAPSDSQDLAPAPVNPAPEPPQDPVVKKRAKEASSGAVKCPACAKDLTSRKALPKHLSACRAWATFSPDVSPSDFDFDRHYQVGVWAPDQLEGQDYVSCRLCEAAGRPFRKRLIAHHLRSAHGLSLNQYQTLYPDAKTVCADLLEVRTATVQERYGVVNVFQLEDVKAKSRETMVRQYGADNPMRSDEIRERIAETNLERYGAANPFASEHGKRKLRETMLERYGTVNPQHIEAVRAKTQQTNLERYGQRFYFQTPEFRAKFERVMQERYGVAHPMHHEPFRVKLRQTNLERYGVENPLLIPSIHAQSLETNKARNGGLLALQTEEGKAKSRATWMRERGVDNPSKDPAVKTKILDTWMRLHGSYLPPAWLKDYGRGPNKFEQRVAQLFPDYKYTGSGRARVRMASGSYRIPDFIKRDPVTRKITHVAEAFGDFWHSPERTGESNEDHEARCIREYAQVGIQCVVVWERDVPA